MKRNDIELLRLIKTAGCLPSIASACALIKALPLLVPLRSTSVFELANPTCGNSSWFAIQPSNHTCEAAAITLLLLQSPNFRVQYITSVPSKLPITTSSFGKGDLKVAIIDLGCSTRPISTTGCNYLSLAIDYPRIEMGFVVIFLDAPRNKFRKNKARCYVSPNV